MSQLLRGGEPGHSLSGCPVRNCCLERDYFACYECDAFETCDKLHSIHQGLHAEACVQNLRAIREMGLEAWLERGVRHCYWTEAASGGPRNSLRQLDSDWRQLWAPRRTR